MPIFMIDEYHPTKKKMLQRKNPRSIIQKNQMLILPESHIQGC